MVKIIAINADFLDGAWLQAKPFIEQALEKGNGEMLIDDVYNYIKDNRFVLLMAFDEKAVAACTLEIEKHPRKKKIAIVHLGGEGMKNFYSDMWEAIKNIAREQKADSITWCGRVGWERVMKDEMTKHYSVGEVML